MTSVYVWKRAQSNMLIKEEGCNTSILHLSAVYLCVFLFGFSATAFI